MGIDYTQSDKNAVDEMANQLVDSHEEKNTYDMGDDDNSSNAPAKNYKDINEFCFVLARRCKKQF